MFSDIKPYITIHGQELERLRSSLRRLFTELLAEDQEVALGPGQWLPLVDLSESPDMITIKVELPGVDADDIRISLVGNLLKVSGQKREDPLNARPICYVCMERAYGSFTRAFNLYWAVDALAAEALLDAGVLTIRLPKLKERRRREIVIPVRVKED
jgi:HSP20 family protein